MKRPLEFTCSPLLTSFYLAIHPSFLPHNNPYSEMVPLYSSSHLGNHHVDSAGLEFREPPASASWVLVLKVCAPTQQLIHLVDNLWLFSVLL